MPFVTSRGARLYYEEHGSGRPIVFVHEFGADLREWAQQVNWFSREYRCIAFNARGYPPSEVPESGDLYGYEYAADDILAVLDGLGIDKAHVVGLSMGAYATLQFGLRHPDRALSLVPAGIGAGAPYEHREIFRQQAEATADRLLEVRTSGSEGSILKSKEQSISPHFLGAIVCAGLPFATGGVALRSVIDGQQRLTTIQLLIRGLLDVLLEAKSERAKSVRRMLFNPSDVVESPDEVYKLWPRRKDRELWPVALGDEIPSSREGSDHLYLQARHFFSDSSRDYAADGGGKVDPAGLLHREDVERDRPPTAGGERHRPLGVAALVLNVDVKDPRRQPLDDGRPVRLAALVEVARLEDQSKVVAADLPQVRFDLVDGLVLRQGMLDALAVGAAVVLHPAIPAAVDVGQLRHRPRRFHPRRRSLVRAQAQRRER